jgi:hypothetical protein
MENHYDPELEAEASMRLAVAADGAERQKWISLAIAWRGLSRLRKRRGHPLQAIAAAEQTGQRQAAK